MKTRLKTNDKCIQSKLKHIVSEICQDNIFENVLVTDSRNC